MVQIRDKLTEYEKTMRLKEDSSKFGKAIMQLQQKTELTELTVLALKVTEELGRAKTNQQHMQMGS